jgi:GAF domain-containing protein
VPEDYLSDLSSADSIARVGEIVRSAARRSASADGATFVLRDRDFCFYADEDAIGPLWKGQRFPIDECISGWAMQHRESVCIADISLDERVPLAAYRPTFVRSLVMVPIRAADPVGAIGAYWASVGAANKAAIDALGDLAAATADAIERIGLADAPWAPNFRVPGGTVRPALQRD